MKFYYLTDSEINNLRSGLMSKKIEKIEKINLILLPKQNLIKANHFLPFISKQKKQKKVIILKKI